MNLLRIASRIASESEMQRLLEKFEQRERKYGREHGKMRIEEEPFDIKYFPRNMRHALPPDATVMLHAVTESGIALYTSVGKDRDEAIEKMIKELRRGCWR